MDPRHPNPLGTVWASACALGLMAATVYTQVAACNRETNAQAPQEPGPTAALGGMPPSGPSEAEGPSPGPTPQAQSAPAQPPGPQNPSPPDCPKFFAATKAGPIMPPDCETRPALPSKP